jgi:signal transduction histidine kinase
VPARPFTVSAEGVSERLLEAGAAFVLPGDRSRGVVLTFIDQTAARQLFGRIQQSERLAGIGTLAAGVAHEIKNALVTGKTFVDLLLEKHPEAELAEIVRREMGRIDTLVARMLKYSGVKRPPTAAVSVHEVLDYSLRLVQSRMENSHIALSREFRADSDRITGDGSELEQAFVNLFLNALDAMGNSGTLTVSTASLPGSAADSPTLQILIHDTGLGIPAADLDRLFEPFFTTKPDGTGLGLAITRWIVEAHRGGVSARSTPEHGTTFEVRLPVSPDCGTA